MNDDHLTPQERQAFDDLPRERELSDSLEDRTVKALHSRSLLQSARPRGLILTTGWISAAAAVICAMLVGAFALGQSMGSQQTADAMLAMHRQDEEQSVETIQQAGIAYLAALSDLVQRSADEPLEQRAQGREAALQSLYQVADQMVLLAPDDPVASRILQAFEQMQTETGEFIRDDTEQQVIWF